MGETNFFKKALRWLGKKLSALLATFYSVLGLYEAAKANIFEQHGDFQNEIRHYFYCLFCVIIAAAFFLMEYIHRKSKRCL